jgi:hypothetical protein
MNEKECATILKRLVYNKDDSEVYDAIIFAIRSLQQRERLINYVEFGYCCCEKGDNLEKTIWKATQLLAEIKEGK